MTELHERAMPSTTSVQPVCAMQARGAAGPWARGLAWLWLALVLAVAVHQFQFWRAGKVDTDVMALLPGSQRTAVADRVLQRMVDGASRDIVVLVGAPDWPAARTAARRFAAAVEAAAPDGDAAALQAVDRLAAFDVEAALAFYRPYRARLLTDAQREALRGTEPETLAKQALASLYQFAGGARLTDWRTDPLALWSGWWLERAAVTRVRERDGMSTVSADGMEWVVLSYRTPAPAFAVNGDTPHADRLSAAEQAARAAVPGIAIHIAGVPLHAEAAAAQANREMNVIGLGSLLAVLLLVWLAFRSVVPIALVGLSLLIGTAMAITVTALVFGQIHLITLVFGASLIGVAEDYGIHYFVTRQAKASRPPGPTMRLLLPGMALALGTSVVAYLSLGIAPFPGLRQMAVFSATGLVAAFVTVVLWFPWLDRRAPRPTGFAGRIGASLPRWPRLRADRRGMLALALLGIFIVAGIAQLRVADDVRQLQSSPASLVDAQRAVERLLGTPSPAQFLLVRGSSDEMVLAREEAVKRALTPLRAQGRLDGVIAVSDWVPSARRQQDDAALTHDAEQAARTEVARVLGDSAMAAQGTNEASARTSAPKPLTVARWLSHPVSQPLRHLWLGRIAEGNDADTTVASVMLLRGVADPAALQQIRAAAGTVAGVEWVDRVADYTGLLRHYRIQMSWLLAAGAGAVALLLWWRYGLRAWRALVPTLLAGACGVAVLGWMHVPLQLFSVLALALLIGVGVDYGIFLLEHPGDGASWTAIVLGAASTLLAFGLLALSATPALHAFGMTMLVGVSAVWLLAPWMRDEALPVPAPSHTPDASASADRDH